MYVDVKVGVSQQYNIYSKTATFFRKSRKNVSWASRRASDLVQLFCYRLLDWYRKEVFTVEVFVSFVVAVVAGVICHYIIKWLDGEK